MSISFQVLGGAGRDNALLVTIDSGQAVERLLFDCGEGCLAGLSNAEIQAIDHLCFSHLHMDHVGGFDSYFRCNFNCDTRPHRIWGPPGTAAIMQHRFQGFLWNLHEQMASTWLVSDIHPDRVMTSRYELHEAFRIAHQVDAPEVLGGAGFKVDVVTLDHRTPTLAYVVREKMRLNVDPSRLASLGLRPGPWIKQLKELAEDGSVMIDGQRHSVAELRERLLTETPGDSIAYLTDFLLDERAMDALVPALQGCRVMVCEGQYRHADLELAHRHFHMTTALSATLAKNAGVEELILFHMSDRYTRSEWLEMIREARQIFPRTSCPSHWELEE